MTQRRTDGELTIAEGSYYKIYRFDTIVRVREPSYENICLSLLHADFFSRKTMFFYEWDAIYLLLMNEIIVFI